jgi:hypothetical protein
MSCDTLAANERYTDNYMMCFKFRYEIYLAKVNTLPHSYVSLSLSTVYCYQFCPCLKLFKL